MPNPAHLSLTPRDLSVLRMAWEYEDVTADLIQRRFFPSPGARSAAYARIAKLVAAGYLLSARVPSLNGVGSGKAVLTIGPKARPLIARVLGISQTELGRSRRDSPLFIQHHLALCEIRLSLEIAVERSPVFSLQDWTGDAELKRSAMRVKDPKGNGDVVCKFAQLFSQKLALRNEKFFIL